MTDRTTSGRVTWIDDAMRDVRTGVRSLRKRPGFTSVALLTLGLGIGASVAMFGVLDLALLEALPYRDADRLVLGRTLWPGGSVGMTVSAPDYYDVRERAGSFEEIGALTPFSIEATLTGPSGPERVSAGLVSPGLFRLLGAAPALGREFVPAEGEPGRDPTVLLSHPLWQRRYGGERDVVGSTITIDGVPMTVVGVLPEGFALINEAEIWLPMVRDGRFATGRQFHNWLVVARLREGVTLERARTEVALIMERLAETYPESNRDKGMALDRMQDALVESYRSSLLLLGGAIVLVLLIACANVASLLLARGSGRRTEVAVRTALGAERGRLVRQLLAENALIGVGAGAIGTAAALVLQRSLVAATPLTRVGIEAAAVRPVVLAFAVGLTALTVLAFGLAPALAAVRVEPAVDLRAGASRGATGSRSVFRSGLVVAQVALSILLLAGAGLLTRSFLELRGVDPGFESGDLLTAEVTLPRGDYPEPERRVQFFRELLERSGRIPGVRAVGLISRLPIRDPGNNVAAWDPADPPADASDWRLAYVRTVLPGYFDALEIPVLRGRDVGPEDVGGGAPVIVISETMARTLFPGRDALGLRVAIDGGEQAPEFVVVGVVGDVRMSGLTGEPPMTMYFSHAQRPEGSMRIALRHSGQPVVEPLRALLREMDADIPLAEVRAMDDVLSGSVAFTRSITVALAAFAAVALFLAAVGLYGVLAFHVAQRRREIGIRMALGASAPSVLGSVVGRGLALVGAGVAIGIPAALLGSRILQDLLYEVGPRDPGTFAFVILVFGATALLACLLPAWRALRVDPVVAFEAE